MTERAVRCGWLDQAARESLQVSVVPVGSGRERLGDMEPLINLHVAKQAIASIGLDSVFGEGSRRGILVISPNTTLVTPG